MPRGLKDGSGKGKGRKDGGRRNINKAPCKKPKADPERGKRGGQGRGEWRKK